MNIQNLFVAALIGYLFGNIQMAYILGQLVRHIDIREHGTTNAGASNATVVLGWRYGILTGLGDVLKATAAVLLIKALYPNVPGLGFIAGGCAVLGHIYPMVMKFRGGKGIAALVGTLLALNGWVGLASILFIAFFLILLDYIAISSIALYVFLPFIVAFFFRYSLNPIALACIISAVGIYKHLSNIRNIRAGTEVGLRAVLKRKA